MVLSNIWVKVFRSGPSKIDERQLLTLKRLGELEVERGRFIGTFNIIKSYIVTENLRRFEDFIFQYNLLSSFFRIFGHFILAKN